VKPQRHVLTATLDSKNQNTHFLDSLVKDVNGMELTNSRQNLSTQKIDPTSLNIDLQEDNDTVEEGPLKTPTKTQNSKITPEAPVSQFSHRTSDMYASIMKNKFDGS
jgi:hypothetical protein